MLSAYAVAVGLQETTRKWSSYELQETSSQPHNLFCALLLIDSLQRPISVFWDYSSVTYQILHSFASYLYPLVQPTTLHSITNTQGPTISQDARVTLRFINKNNRITSSVYLTASIVLDNTFLGNITLSQTVFYKLGFYLYIDGLVQLLQLLSNPYLQ